jgi:hypothetical protein
VGAELLHADGRTDRQTDMTKLKVTFRNFANAPKRVITIYRSTPPSSPTEKACQLIFNEKQTLYIEERESSVWIPMK